jgi:hypothetical protein
MKKLINNPWFVAGLAVCALVLIGRAVLPAAHARLTGGGFAAPGATSVPAGSEVAASPAPVSVNDALRALPIAANPRDPFAPKAKPAEPLVAKIIPPDLVDKVHLSALWTQDGATLALINDQICQAGDEVGRIKIESTTRDGVWVTHWKGRDFIALGGDFTLNTPATRIGGDRLVTLTQ